jgi:uncharacterized protein YacL (UPF0231 family)
VEEIKARVLSVVEIKAKDRLVEEIKAKDRLVEEIKARVLSAEEVRAKVLLAEAETKVYMEWEEIKVKDNLEEVEQTNSKNSQLEFLSAKLFHSSKYQQLTHKNLVIIYFV